MKSCLTSKLPIIKKNLPCDSRISCRQILLYTLNKCDCYLSTMSSFFNKVFTVIGINNRTYSKYRIGNRKFPSKLPIIVFQINSISLIDPDEFRKTSIVFVITSKNNDSF